MLTTNKESAHVWLRSDTVSVPPELLEVLSPSEQRRAEQIRHERARAHFVHGRHLLRTALSYYAPVDPQDWNLGERELGKPRVVGPPAGAHLGFNLSHTEGLIACVVTSGLECGLDVEALDRPLDAIGIATHSFRSEEREFLEQIDSPGRERHFFALWTLKEAYLKARGSGIRLRLDSVGFRIRSDRRLEVELGPHEPSADEWFFALYEPTPRHRLALALDRRATLPVEITGWELDHRLRPRRVPLPILASSEQC